MVLEFLLTQALPIACMIVMGGLLFVYLVRYFAPAEPPDKPGEPLALRPLLARVLILLIASRAFLYLAALAMAAVKGELSDFTANPLGAWIRWDANHYLGLAKNWYQNEGDPRFHIVFYPLYPLLVRVLQPLFLGNTVLAAFFTSNACLFLSGWALYRLVEAGQGRDAGLRALRYLMLCPLSLFFSIPYSESLFLLLTLSSVLMARRRHMPLAVALGALASATRLLGLLCAVPVFYEFLQMARERREKSGHFVTGLLKGFALTFLVALGFGAYLLLNKAVTGNPFQFLIYQREHWSQQFGSLYNSVQYTATYLLGSGDDFGVRFGIWLPQLVCIALVLAPMCATARRLHPSDGAYALIYFYAALSPTWLLSGPRYLAAMYPLYPMLALVTRRKWQDAAMTTLLLVLGVYCAYMYAVVGSLL